MFIAHKDHQFRIPQELCEPGTTHWRAIHLSTGAAWYVLTSLVREAVPADEGPIVLRRTFLLSWDTDVADAVTALGDDVVELLCVAQGRGRRRSAWVTHQVTEIWRGLDQEENPSVVFVCDNGSEITGLLADLNPGHRKTELIARIKPKATFDSSMQ
jgi:hypothetical protein